MESGEMHNGINKASSSDNVESDVDCLLEDYKEKNKLTDAEIKVFCYYFILIVNLLFYSETLF